MTLHCRLTMTVTLWCIRYQLVNSYFRPAQSSEPFDTSSHWASGRIFCTPSSPVHITFTFMAKQTCQNRFFKYNNPRTVYFSALLLCMQKNRRNFYNNSATQNGVSACVYFQRQRRWFSARDARVTMQIVGSIM